MNINVKPRRYATHAFTLVELLVVISILLILVAILIPNIRTVTKERNIREAARVVGALFAQASDRGAIDGVAGIVLFPNPNFVIESNGDGVLDANDFQYAVTRLALLRRVPNYTGDSNGARATRPISPVLTPDPGTVIAQINLPIEQQDVGLIAQGDSISLNNNSHQYIITEILNPPGSFRLELELALSTLPDPTPLLDSNAGNGVPFVITRSPRILRSSELELPSGHVIDLRYSGFDAVDTVAPEFPTRVFERNPLGTLMNRPIALLFDETGALDRMGQNDTSSGAANSVVPQGPLHLFITEAESPIEVNPLANASNLWVSVSNGSGAVNIGNNISSATAGLSVGDLENLLNGIAVTSVDPSCTAGLPARNCFNAVIAGARGDALNVSAGQ